MPIWNKLSGDAAKKREAAFEAQMLAELAKDAPVAPPRVGIQITVNGRQYDNLAEVPAAIRQQILNAWQPAAPPVIRVEPLLPAAPRPRSRRTAGVLNLFLPGAGQIYVGQPVMGSVFALSFLACFLAAVVIFVRGYAKYLQLSTSGDILDAGALEQLTNLFPMGVLVGLLVAAAVIYIASAIHLSHGRRD
jgi:hypothetical protein